MNQHAMQTTQQPAQASILAKMAARFSVEPTKMLSTLKATAFKGDVSNEQMMALLIVADQYGLNPWTKEIYAFPDRQNGIVPVVGVDGWSRMMNANAQFDGIEFDQSDDACTCKIYRKDRTRAIAVTEYLSECRREAKPWQTHPKRMLRHKAMIQCARLAFGFVGVFDQDEASAIVEKDITPSYGSYEDTATVKRSTADAVKDEMRARATATAAQKPIEENVDLSMDEVIQTQAETPPPPPPLKTQPVQTESDELPWEPTAAERVEIIARDIEEANGYKSIRG